MLWRSQSHLLVFLALVTPIAMPALAFAQDHAPPPASTAPEGSPPSGPPAPAGSSSGTPPSAPAPSSTAPDDRPPLIPPASGGAAVVSPPMVSPAPATLDGAAPVTQKPPDTGEIAAPDHEVFSEDWWGRVHPVVELHGYFRTRGELFQNLGLGRHGSIFQGTDPQYLAPLPLDQSYQRTNGNSVNVNICGPAGLQPCFDETESSAK